MLLLPCKAHDNTVCGWPSPQYQPSQLKEGSEAMSGYELAFIIIKAIDILISLIMKMIFIKDLFSEKKIAAKPKN